MSNNKSSNSQFLAFVKKEFFHVFRDKKTLFLLFGMPIAQILLFGFALSNEIKNSKILVCDYAHDQASKTISDRLEASNYFEIGANLTDINQVNSLFQKGNYKLAVVFPAQFENNLLHQNNAQIQLIADASDPNTATTLINYASSIIMDYQKELIGDQKQPLQIVTESRMVYNPELKGATNFVPGVMSLVLLLVCVLMTSVSIVKEKELGTMEILLVSPFNPFLVIISKAIPYLLLSIVNLVLILLMSVYLLGMTIQGSIVLLFLESILFITTALCLGLLISNLTNSQQVAMLISLMGMLLPTVIFTGFMFPIENMPLPLQLISNIIPSKWYYTIVKAIMIKGLGFSAVWKETLVLCGITVVLLVISIKKFSIRLG